MNKKLLFIFVLSVCIICLILGMIKHTPAPIKAKTDNLMVKSQKIAVINLDGVISSSSSNNIFEEDSPSVTALKAINKAEEEDNVKGIILRINSPGGTVGMSQRLYSAVYNARLKKPVIAVMDDIATSGGYYVASAADRIVSLPGTITGSIGVIMSTMDLHKLLTEKLSINENVIKSGKYKDMGSSTRAMTTDERKLLQDMVDDSYRQFKEAIINGRVKRDDNYSVQKVDLTLANINKYADGRVFTGSQALKYGFVDSNGGMREAQKMMDKMVSEKFGISQTKQLDYDVNYSKTTNLLKLLGVKSDVKMLNEIIPQSVQYAGKPLYLWE